MSLARLGGVYALLHAGHEVGDHLVQTDHQANHKGEPGWEGRWACIKHIATLTATQGAFLAFGCLTTGERLSGHRIAAGLAVNAVTHYAADRRDHGVLPKLAKKFAWAGKDKFYALGDGKAAPCGTGAYAIDKSWHIFWLAIAAAIITGRK